MAVSRLVLTDFRNHADAVLAPGGEFVVLTGENGAGKTNILEALSLLAPGRGLRGAPLGEMARQGGSGGFGIAATIDPAEIGTGTRPDAPERRIVRVNGATAAATSLAQWLGVLWLTPAMDRLFLEAPGGRRRFLDRLTLALAPGHAHEATRYEAAMRERNRLLTDTARAPDPRWLDAIEARMAEHGAAIDAARRDAVRALDARLAEQPQGPFARAALTIADGSGDGAGTGDAGTGDAAALAAALRAGRRRDAVAGRTLTGPHRADLKVTHLDKQQPAHLCSTGEQKALLLGIVLAHAELVRSRAGRAPILLLDEVAAHLDPGRRAALFERLAGHGQVWMTGTEPALFDAVPASATRYRVAEGRVSRD